MRVAVIGAGVFGVTVALRLDALGFQVDVFDRKPTIFAAASGINQYRIHRGYHYPRSSETANLLLSTVTRFQSEYGDSLIEAEVSLYAIASAGSMSTPADFRDFMDTHGLEYREVQDVRIEAARIGMLVAVREQLLDLERLRAICVERLALSGVRLRLGEPATESSTDTYDRVVVCGYAGTNSFFDRNYGLQESYQFEVCEKPVVEMPGSFGEPSIVILDGPFMCVDPLGKTGRFVLGNVVHAIHATNIGGRPEVPAPLEDVLDAGIVPPPPFSRFDAFVESGRRFIPALANARHVGSMFTVRTVLPRMEETDARPTIVRAVDGRVVTVFSGKLATCVDAAEQVARILELP